jgi:hypothetical protein
MFAWAFIWLTAAHLIGLGGGSSATSMQGNTLNIA